MFSDHEEPGTHSRGHQPDFDPLRAQDSGYQEGEDFALVCWLIALQLPWQAIDTLLEKEYIERVRSSHDNIFIALTRYEQADGQRDVFNYVA